ncbi:MAG: flavodoxin [Candidatus Adiutrix sp.]|nr:flavodoxin [Candidatus Adiutrix sp.]
MANVLIVYGSTTGNTEWVAGQLKEVWAAAGNDVEVVSAGKAKADGLCQGRDLVAFGCSTWGQDEVELQDDFIPLFEKFDSLGAGGVKTAVFGCGDEDYTHFCGAVDAITEKLEALGAKLLGGKLKINGDPGDSAAEIKSWASAVASAM